ncbi:hypothetical protein B0H11DRAFT_2229611 [Mycena galericulata]|nr:hypothetical protein B0H11DRAFT_2229611 [Mycena galericulata]
MATRAHRSAAADNPLSTPRRRGPTGTAVSPIVVTSSSPSRTPGSAANPLMLPPTPARQTRSSTGQSQSPTPYVVRTVASTRAARVAAGEFALTRPSAPVPLRAPPSTIPRSARPTAGERGQPYPPGLLGDTSARDAATRQRNRARIDAESAAYRAAHPSVVIPRARPRLRPAGLPKASDGSRIEREEPLTLESLLSNGVGPPIRSTMREHQKCSICLHIKSHPVAYRCGHSHCYRCIRLWLETNWTCPECRTVMNEAPCRNYSEEAGILLDHPEWHDRSRVDYSWEGLRFPKVKLLSDW